jgi:hypothetical protein
MRRATQWVWTACVVGTLATDALAGDPAARLEARVDARVELLSLIFRLAGNAEYNQPQSKSPYGQEVDEYFDKFRGHPVVTMATRLRQSTGVSFDAVMTMAVHLEDTEGLQPRMPLDPRPANLDERWRSTDAREFLEQARKFVAETKFNAFFGQHRKLYAAATERMTEKLSERAYVDWFDKFFGQRERAKFCVIVGMLNGPCSYGVSVRWPDGREEITPVIGAAKFDADGIPVFSDKDVPTIVHEFCHSYTNPIVDRHAEQLRPAGERIFKHCEAVMSDQAYGDWQTMMRESLVRACVVRYLQTTDGADAAHQEVQENAERGFKWIGKLTETFGEYEAHRERYPDFDAFMPRVVSFFDGYAQDYAEEAQALAAKAPKVLRMVPTNGATDVDPNLKEIRVWFDRPMKDESWSVVGGGPNFPETPDKPHYEQGRTLFVLPVRLKPDWSYQFWLNRGRFNGFRSEDGVALQSVEVTFKTRE